MKTPNVGLKTPECNADTVYDAVALSYRRNSARLDSDLRDDKHGGIDSYLNMKIKALEAGQFEQGVQMRR